MSENNSLEAILRQIDQETCPEELGRLAHPIQEEAEPSKQAIYLSLAAEDKAGLEHWLSRLQQCRHAVGVIRERLVHFRDLTTLELQWLQSMKPEANSSDQQT